jgi:hypothetical protein
MSALEGLERHALKLVMKLSREGARLEPERDGDKVSFRLFQGRRAGLSHGVSVSFDFVKTLHKEDLIAPNQGGFVLSEAGAAWLRRKLASGDPFREQHQQRAMETAEIEGVRRPALVDETESPLGWLRRRKDKAGRPMIDAAQFEAGERLRRDFFHAGLTPRVTASWDGIPGDRASRRAGPGASANLREQTVAAQQRVRRAMEAVGPDLASILLDVCCHLKGLEEAEREKGWPRRSAKLVLQIALKELARHYGLLRAAADTARDSSRRLVHWGAADYKPRSQDV